MNEGQIALNVLIAIFILTAVGFIIWWVHEIGKISGKFEERRRVAGESKFSDPTEAKSDQIKEFERTTGRLWLEPGADTLATVLPTGRIELTQVHMPWRLEIASRAMPGILNNSPGLLRIHNACGADYDKVRSEIALLALDNADALLKAFNESTPKKTPDIRTFHGVGFEEERESEYDLHTKGAKVPRFEI